MVHQRVVHPGDQSVRRGLHALLCHLVGYELRQQGAVPLHEGTVRICAPPRYTRGPQARAGVGNYYG